MNMAYNITRSHAASSQSLPTTRHRLTFVILTVNSSKLLVPPFPCHFRITVGINLLAVPPLDLMAPASVLRCALYERPVHRRSSLSVMRCNYYSNTPNYKHIKDVSHHHMNIKQSTVLMSSDYWL